MFSLALVLSVCVAGAVANPSKVCIPDQWSGALFGAVAQVQDGKPAAYGISGYTATDYPKKMEYVVQNITVNDAVLTYVQVTDFNKMMTYQIQPSERKCTATALPAGSEMKQYCEGDADLKVLDELKLGGNLVQVVELPSHNRTVYTSLVKGTFSPIMMVLEQTYMGIPQMFTYQYGNVTDKIMYPEMFDVPSYCTPPVPHKRVCAHDQFEAVGLAVVAEVSNGKPMALPTEFMIARDFKAKKEASVSLTSFQGQQYIAKSITDWNEGKTYFIYENLKTCNVTDPFTATMTEFCSDSKDLTPIRSYMVNGKMADVYAYSGAHQRTEIAVFRDTFEFITSLSVQRFLGIPQIIASQYGNMTAGIKDPKVFDLPSYCKHNVLMD